MNKKIMIVAISLVMLLAVSAASAAENATSDVVEVDETTDEVVDLEDANDELISLPQEDTVGITDNGTFTELNSKIENAPEGSVITLENDYFLDKRFGTDGISISKSLTINGNGHKIDANSKSTIFSLNSNNIILENIIFVNGYAKYGGAISNGGSNNKIDSCIFNNCSGVKIYSSFDNNDYGGAIYNLGEKFIVSSCAFNNCSSYNGGAIYTSATNSNITSCIFNNCYVGYQGGAIATDFECSINSCNFTNCSSQNRGGAILNAGETCDINYCNFTLCSAPNSNVIHNQRGNYLAKYCKFDLKESEVSNIASFENCTFKDSHEGPETPDVIEELDDGTFTALDDKIYDAKAGSTINFVNDYLYDDGFSYDYISVKSNLIIDGKGHKIDARSKSIIFMLGGNLILKNITFINAFNDDEYNGGGAIIIPYDNCSIIDCTFINCSANKGGAIFNYADDAYITSCNFINCSANKGATIYNDWKTGCYITSCNFSDESSSNTKVIYSDGVTINAVNCTFIDIERARLNNANVNLVNPTFISSQGAKITEIQANNNVYGNHTIIKVKTNVAGTLKIKVDLSTNTDSISANSLKEFDLGILDVGVHPIEITLIATGYDNVVANTQVNVTRKPTTIGINVEDSVYGENVVVNVTASISGKISVKLGDTVKNVDVDADKTTPVDFGIVDADAYAIVASFEGDYTSLPANATSSVTVGKANPVVKASDVEFDYGSQGTSTVTISGNDVTLGNISIINHPEAVISAENNIITVSNLSVGSFVLSVATAENKNYNPASTTANVTVNIPVITIANFNKFFNSNGELIVDFKELTFNGEFEGISFNINRPVTLIGQDATFANSKFTVSSDNVTIENIKLNYGGSTPVIAADGVSNFTLKDNQITFKGMSDNDYAISITNSNGVALVNNNIQANGSGHVYGIFISAGDLNIEANVLVLSSAEYAYGINIVGPSTGVVKNNNLDVKAQKAAYSINTNTSTGAIQVSYINNTINSEAYFAVGIYDDSELIKDNKITLAGNYAIGVVVLSEATVDNNDIKLTASNTGSDDTVHDDVGIETAGIKVKNSANIINNNIDSSDKSISIVGGNSSISDNNLNGHISVESSNNNIANNVINTDNSGYAIVLSASATDNTVDGNVLTANGTKGNEAVSDESGSNNQIANNKANPNLAIGHIDDVTEGENVVIAVNADKDFQYAVSLQVGKYNTTVTLTNGKGNVTIPADKLSVGEIIVKVSFNGNDNYSSDSANTTFTVKVKPIDPMLTISVASITQGDNAVIKVTTNATFTGDVSVSMASKNYIVNVVNGVGSKSVSGLGVGTYTATATFAATDVFTASTKSATFNVAKKQDVIKLTLAKAKVKRSAKKLVIKATLKINGKAKKGLKVKFKFNKKSYTAKTDKKGVAKITIGKKVLKKLKKGKKVTYQASYNNKNVKQTVKVQK